MEISPSWAANSTKASQEIPHVLWNQNIRYYMQKKKYSWNLMSA